MKNNSKSDFLINQSKVIFIDGLIGGGKSLIANIIGSIEGVDWWRYESKFEHICTLNYLQKIKSEDATNLLIKFYNEIYYDNFILRSNNFRKKDLTSVYRHPRSKKILNRLKFDDHLAKKKFKKSKIIIPFMTHFNSLSSEPLFKTFGGRLIYVYLAKSPYDIRIINLIANWTSEWEKKKHRFTILTSFDKQSKKFYPNFIKRYKDEYIKINKFEKAILILKIFSDNSKNLKRINYFKKKYKSKVVVIPFESLIVNPKKYIKILLKNLNKKSDNVLLRSLKKNNVPRNSNFLDNLSKKIMKKKFKEDSILKYFKKKISKKYLFELIKTKKNYETFINRI